ncbi:MAG: ornithine cyclodeaminase family protein [Desulfurococcaceae archaeon]
MELLYLSRRDVESLNISYNEVINAVELSFKLKGEGKVQLPPKPGVNPRPNSFIHAMPAYVGEVDVVGVKWVSGYLGNPARGLPYINAILILNDPETGLPVAVMDATWITAVRTAAASAVAVKYMASPGAESLGIVGLGVQGRTHLLAIREVLRLRRVYVYDVIKQKVKAYIEEMSPQCPEAEIMPCEDYKCVTRNSDVVVTATYIVERPKRFIALKDLREEFLAIPVDYDAAFEEDVARAVDVFVVDDKEQYLVTKGKEKYFKGYPDIVEFDMGDVVAGRAGDLRVKARKMALLMGIASHDVVVAKLIYDKAIKRGVGVKLPL